MRKAFTKERLLRALSRGLLLLLGLWGGFFSFLTSFPVTVDEGELTLVCLIAGLLSLFVFSLPKARHRLPLAGVWLLWLFWTVWQSFDDLRVAALLCAQRVGGVFAKQIGFGLVAPSFPEYTQGVPLVTQRELCTLLCALVIALLALALGWAVVRKGSFWLGVLFTCPFLIAPLSITITPPWLPLWALLLFWLVSLLTRLAGKNDAKGSARLTLVLLPAGACLLLAVGALLPQEKYSDVPWVEGARSMALERLTSAGSHLLSGTVPGGFAGLPGTTADVSLKDAGPLRYLGTTVLRVESEISGHIYLRGFSAGAYGADGWEQLGEGAYEVMRKGLDLTNGGAALPWQEPQPGIGEFQPLNFPAMASANSPQRRFAVEMVGAGGYVYTPYQLATTPERMAGAEFVDDAYVARSAGIRRYVLYARSEANPKTSRGFSAEDAAVEQIYSQFVGEHYLEVPQELAEIFSTLINREDYEPLYSISGGDIRYGGLEKTAVEVTREVADLLAELAVYDLDTPLTPEGEDFVVHFLTTSHRGYCMHFASAATLMLRYLGIPARYTVGYTADVRAGQTVDVPDKNAHAWVEIYMDGYGWHPVEVTPGFSGRFPWSVETNAPITPKPSVTAPPDAPHTPPPSVAPRPPAPTVGGGEETPIDWTRLFDPMWLLVPAALYLAWRLMKGRYIYAQNRRRMRFYADDVNGAVIAMYVYSQRLLPYHKGEEMAPYAEALGQKARFSLHTLTEDERRRMLSYTTGLSVRTYYLVGRVHRIFLRYVLGLC